MTLLLSGCEPRPTRATIEGDWVSHTAAGDVSRVFSFRGDSALRVGVAGARWQPYALHDDSLTIAEERTFAVAFSGDTLILAAPGRRRIPLIRLQVGPAVPRPERIAFSRYVCMWEAPFSSCPPFDFEIDSAGTVHYQRHTSWDRSVRYVGEGRRARSTTG